MTHEIIEVQPHQVVAQSATPADLLQMAVQQGADIDKLEKLMALQERWEASQARKAYDAAFAAFKSEGVKIIKGQRVMAGPLQGGRYAGLNDVVKAVTEALSRHGLSSSWKLTKDEKDWLEVTCFLRHVGGHEESVSMGGPPDAGGAKNPLQARASTKTYLERYTLKAILGLSEDGDDTDGNAAPEEQGENPALQAGRDAAMQGTQALTEWWKRLSQRDQKAMNKEFGALRAAARKVDEGAIE